MWAGGSFVGGCVTFALAIVTFRARYVTFKHRIVTLSESQIRLFAVSISSLGFPHSQKIPLQACGLQGDCSFYLSHA